MGGVEYKPSVASKANEKEIKDPLIAEHNTMSAKFIKKKISLEEFNAFKGEWFNRFISAMNPAIKIRTYTEDTTDVI